MTKPAIGVLLPAREAAIAGAKDARPLIDLARAAEDAGFDSIWAGDSLIARPRAEPLTLLAGVAAVCSGVSIGTAALTAAIRHPLLAAHSIATLDQIANGRLVLGLGAGFPYPETEKEFAVAGVPFHERVGRLLETVDLWRLLWDKERSPDERIDFRGRYWDLEGIEGLPRPHRDGGPPLWLAGASPKTLERCGQLFDGWLPYPPDSQTYSSGWSKIRDAATAAGRDPTQITAGLYVTVNLGPRADEARAELEEYVRDYYDVPLEVMEGLQGFFAGDAAGCVEWLSRYVEAGARHIVLRFGSFDARGQLERAAAELLPNLK